MLIWWRRRVRTRLSTTRSDACGDIECQTEGCDKYTLKGGHCVAHGGGR